MGVCVCVLVAATWAELIFFWQINHETCWFHSVYFVVHICNLNEKASKNFAQQHDRLADAL